jgi:hypothetical protein
MSKHICDEEFPWCTRKAKAGESYKLRVKDLSPTQFATGRAEVMVKAGRLRKKYKADPQHLHDYLRLRPVRSLFARINSISWITTTWRVPCMKPCTAS